MAEGKSARLALSRCKKIAGYYAALYSDHQAHDNAFRFVMVGLVEKIHGAQAGSETQGGSSGFAADSTSDKWPHDGIGFAISAVEATLGSEGIGRDQAGEDPGVDFRFERPKAMLARRVGYLRTRTYKALRRCCGGE